MTPGLPTAEKLAGIAARSQALADVFTLPLRNHVWRGQAGDFQGGGTGSSLDFQDHRTYVPGDDPRHINWQAFARTGNYSMKMYREEVRPLVDLVFDVSDSMFFDPVKRDRCLEIFYFCLHAAWKSGASLKITLIRGDNVRLLSDVAIHSHTWAQIADDLPDTDAAAAPGLRNASLRARSLRIYLSDLLHTGAPDNSLRELGRAGGRAIIFAPFSRSEADPAWEGNYEFVEAESRERIPHRVDRSILKRYHGAYQRHFSLWSTQSRRFDILLARVPAEGDLRRALQHEAIASGALEL